MANTITGMFKVFYKNSIIDYANAVTASSGSATLPNLYDLDRSTRWISSGSNDSTTEYIEFVFDNAQTFNRIAILNCNWKNFQIKYDSGGVYTNFSTVYSKKSDVASASSINITNNTDIARYFEFASVTTTKIRFYIDTTMTTNAEKYVYEIYLGQEIGTFIADLTSKPNDYAVLASYKRAQYLEKSNGGMIKIERADKYRAKANLKQIWDVADLVILQTMYDYGEVAIYPCGAYEQYTTERGWRIQDFYHVLVMGDEPSDFDIGRDKNIGQNFKFDVNEL